MIFALLGNQNSGKTTLFNALTGANQHVGNFPGVTVEKKSGEIKLIKGASVVDLPGIYSLRPYTAEESVTRDFLIDEKPAGIINIVDATNIERNLYLTLQLLELRRPMVVALNMMDEVRGNSGYVNIAGLSEALGVPVIPISAAKNEGLAELAEEACKVVEKGLTPTVGDFCPEGAVHRCIHAVSHIIEDHAKNIGASPRFCATKLIEGDSFFAKRLGIDKNEEELIEHSVLEMESETGLDRNEALADMRYNFIESAVKETVVKPLESRERKRSEKIDKVLTGKYTALPLFVAVMLIIFTLTFSVIGPALSDLLNIGIDNIIAGADVALTNIGLNPVVHSLIIDGVFSGVGSVLGFLPIVVTLFFFLSVLEDTGYMARVAFVMDKLLRHLGLSGKSVVPMLIGFGCTVPAVMASRTLSSARDRKMTVLLTPFISCSAKIPIYSVFAAAFFPRHGALVMAGLYFGGIAMAVLCALVLKKTAFTGKPVPFVMELPDYRFPSLKSVALLLWEKAKDFITRAFTVIFVASVLIWFLQSFDSRLFPVTSNSESLLALLGKFIAPIFTPLGFGDWRAATALIAGFSAKEAVVSTLGVLLSVPAGELPATLSAIFTPAAAVSYLVFTLLYTPCVAAVNAIRRELHSTATALWVVLIQCALAYAVAFLVYNVAIIL